jgi:two-component system OmpR family response regulator
MQKKVLIVEDEADIARLLQSHLKDIGCNSDVAPTVRDARNLFEHGDYALVILDLMLPDGDGISLCREMRQAEGYIPILMLTAKSTELDRVLGLEVGADDYLTKPFSIAELLARVKALFRRTEALSAPATDNKPKAVITAGSMVIDPERRKVKLDGAEVELTAREFDLLYFFASHPGKVFNRIELLQQVWGYNHDGYEHTVNSHINRLRAKIEANPSKPGYVLTVWGVGYRFSDGLE